MSSIEEIVIDIQNGNDRKNELYERIWKLIRLICIKYAQAAKKQYFELDDLISAAWFGVENAIKAYTPDKGLKFNSYLQYNIRNAVYDLLGFRGGAEKRKPTLHLDAPLKNQDGEKMTLADTLPDIEAEEAFDGAEYCDYYNALMSELEKLTPEHTEIIKRHFLENETITHIADTKGVSVENVAAKKRKALRKLRQSKKLKDCYYAEIAYRHISVSKFNTTWTSSTEWAALKLMQNQTGMQNLKKPEIKNLIR